MKRVFEGKFFTKSSKTTGGMVKTMRLYKTCVDFIDCLSPNKPFRITVEDLPESKPEPKNCGNCGAGHTGCKTEPGKAYCTDWQPKAAEPQGWEIAQKKICARCLKEGIVDRASCDGTSKGDIDTCTLLGVVEECFRAEIERVREEEKQAIVAFLRGHWLMTDGLAPMAGDIEQNKHREGGE